MQIGRAFRITVLVCSICAAAISLAQTDHLDEIIIYLDCSGVAQVAKLEGNSFRVKKRGDPSDWKTVKTVTKIICYETWGGGNWTATLRNGRFQHTPYGGAGQAHPDTIIRYRTWDGSEWTAYVVNRYTFRHIPKVLPAKATPKESNDIAADLDFALHDGGTLANDCLHGHGGCCFAVNGIQPRSWIASQAVVAAKNGACAQAVVMLVSTQCHNSDQATLLATHEDDTCAELKKH
jgi:hypothetical protein